MSAGGLNSETLGNVAAALIAAQAEFAPALKDATNPHFNSKFVSLQGVLTAVASALRANGIALVQQTDRDDDGTTVLVTSLIHTSGEWLSAVYPVRPIKSDPQAEGSALTYARRYSLMALVGIAPEDDDGHAASQPARNQSRQAAQNQEWASYDDPAMYSVRIDKAGTVAELEAVAEQIKAGRVREEDRAPLRVAYDGRMGELSSEAVA